MKRASRPLIWLWLIVGGLWFLLVLSDTIAERLGLEQSLWLAGPLMGIYAVAILLAAGQTMKYTRMRKRQEKGRCIVCNYKLGDFETCPECGTPVEDMPRGGAC